MFEDLSTFLFLGEETEGASNGLNSDDVGQSRQIHHQSAVTPRSYNTALSHTVQGKLKERMNLRALCTYKLEHYLSGNNYLFIYILFNNRLFLKIYI